MNSPGASRDTLNPLRGLRVLVTRAQEQAESFSSRLQEQGATVSEIAVLAIRPPADSSDLDNALANIESYDWIIFASQNAVIETMARIKANEKEAAILDNIKVASIGPATSELLNQFKINVAFQPQVYVAEAFVAEFPGYPNLAGSRILWPKTNIGRRLIAEQLQAAGAQVDTPIAYESGLPDNAGASADKIISLLSAHSIDVITLASAQTARNLAALIELGLKQKFATAHAKGTPSEGKTIDKKQLLAGVKIAAIGPITAAAAAESLGRVDIVADEHTLTGLTDALLASLKFPQKQ